VHNRGLYESFSEDQLIKMISDNWGLYHESIVFELQHGKDNVLYELHESLAAVLLYDKEALLDKIGMMDKYIYQLKKAKGETI